MSGLPTFFRDLVEAGPLPLGPLTAGALRERSARDLRTVATQGLDLLGEGMGTALVEAGLLDGDVAPPLSVDALRAEPDFAPVLAAERTVGEGDDDAAARWTQRLLQAVGARVPNAPAALRLAVWGADGVVGRETLAALAAARAAFGLTGAGPFGRADAEALLERLADAPVPDLFAPLPPLARVSEGARRVVQLASALVAATDAAPLEAQVDGTTFSYTAADFGVKATRDGTLEAPGGVSYGLRTANEGYWKCNILAGTVIGLAGLPDASFYWSRHHRTKHYPRAERFGPRLAALPGWTLVRHLDHRDPADETTALVGPTQQAEIEELLRTCLPGDLLFVDHPGVPGNNGGHSRVCVDVAAPHDVDAAPAFAQAREDQARTERDGLFELGQGNEIQFFLVRFTG